MDLHQQFKAWLKGPGAGTFTFQKHEMNYVVIKAQKNADFDYLYTQHNYRCSSIKYRDKFEYAGIYCRRDGLLYDVQYHLRTLGEPLEGIMSLDAKLLLARMIGEVCDAVVAAIGNDRSKLRVKKLTQIQDLNALEHVKEYGAAKTARDLFLSGVDGSAPHYCCSYTSLGWSEDSLLEYILKPEGYVSRTATAYIAEDQDAILLAFLKNDEVAKEYVALAGNPQNPIHTIRKIMWAMRTTEAKTVRVVIRKDGKEFSFKTDANDMRRDCGFHYDIYHIIGADKGKFEDLFGQHSHYDPSDILRIVYGRTTIYEAEGVQA